MDITLPDGTTIKNMPEGTTQGELVRRLKAGGHDTSWYKEPAAPTPAAPAPAPAPLDPAKASGADLVARMNPAQIQAASQEMDIAGGGAEGVNAESRGIQ